MSGLTALVLAGSRPGAPDPMAVAAGVAHKALLPVAGVPMLRRVVQALRGTEGIGRIVVCAQQAAELLAAAQADAIAREAESGPSQSVAAMLAEFGTPLLVTTADHALLTPAMVAHFVEHAPAGADAVAGVARSEVVRGAYPESRRTWMRFRGGAYSGCNLFLLQGAEATRVVAFWQRLERDRKRPLAMACLLGVRAMLVYLLRLRTLPGMLELLGRTVGARLAVVELPFADAAVDVDRLEDLELANLVLRSGALPPNPHWGQRPQTRNTLVRGPGSPDPGGVQGQRPRPCD